MPISISGEDLHQWKKWAVQLAKANDIDPYEIEWLLQGLTTLPALRIKLDDYREQHSILCSVTLSQLTQKWQSRVFDRAPLQYLVGETPWRDFSIAVTPDVLIPRPETELIIDLAKALALNSSIAECCYEGNWADIGTGSGAIALGLAKAFPKATIFATDISEQALKVAQRNMESNHLSGHISFLRGSWLEPLTYMKEQLTGIISNPPYIPSQTVLTLQPEVSNHEPHLALDGGIDGLSYLRILVEESADYLQVGGLWLAELMEGQANTVADLLDVQGQYTNIAIHEDLSGIERFVSAYKAL